VSARCAELITRADGHNISEQDPYHIIHEPEIASPLPLQTNSASSVPPIDNIDAALHSDSFCREPVVDAYPDDTAGAPISNDRYHAPDPRVYLKSCGRLARRVYFEDAELLMTTGLSNKGRDRHLRSRRVSVYPCGSG
jgi:hypothetical protein